MDKFNTIVDKENATIVDEEKEFYNDLLMEQQEQM